MSGSLHTDRAGHGNDLSLVRVWTRRRLLQGYTVSQAPLSWTLVASPSRTGTHAAFCHLAGLSFERWAWYASQARSRRSHDNTAPHALSVSSRRSGVSPVAVQTSRDSPPAIAAVQLAGSVRLVTHAGRLVSFGEPKELGREAAARPCCWTTSCCSNPCDGERRWPHCAFLPPQERRPWLRHQP